MKNLSKTFGSIVLMALLIFSAVSCDTAPSTDNSNQPSTGNNQPSTGDKPPTTAITLAAGTWADGSLSFGEEQWFTFTASASTQYIHFKPDTLSRVNVQLYHKSNDTILPVGDQAQLYGISRYISKTVINGQTYYIKATPLLSSGAYKIAFTSSSLPPVTALTLNTWVSGSIKNLEGEEWFSFIATAETQYIHFNEGTISYGVNYQLYDNTLTQVGGLNYLSSSSLSSLTIGQQYYIRVTPYYTNVGMYEIGFTTTSSPPPISGGLPTTGITQLTVDTWADGEIIQDGEQWFSFTATAATQYIRFEPGTATSVYIRLYDNNGSAVGSRTSMGNGIISGTYYSSRSVTIGQKYYIRVIPDSTSAGTYTITVSLSASSFEIPDTGITVITAGIWADGNISTAGGGQWFSFTPTVAYNYLFYRTETLGSMYIQIFNADGSISTRYPVSRDSSWIGSTYTIGQTYYIRVWPTSSVGTGTFKIGFNSSSDTPQSQ